MRLRAPSTLLFLLGLIAFAGFGCGKLSHSEKKEISGSDHVTGDPAVFAALSKVELSSVIGIEVPGSCDPRASAQVLDASPPPEGGDVSARVTALWGGCRVLYACSPSARGFLAARAGAGDGFRAAFADFTALEAQLPSRPAGSGRIHGLYHSGTQGVYLESSIRSYYEGCHLLLHELVHRFDPEAQANGGSFQVEYRAYHLQTAFSGELAMDSGALGRVMNSRPRFHSPSGPAAVSSGVRVIQTRDSLVEYVAMLTGRPPQPSVALGFPVFRWETLERRERERD